MTTMPFPAAPKVSPAPTPETAGHAVPTTLTPEALGEEAVRGDLLHAWQRPRGLVGWLSEVSHTAIGLRTIVTALVFFLLAGALSLVMRLQLAAPDAGVVGPDLYNQLFTTHGSTMMFLFAVPVTQGLGVYFVPLMIGTRNVAFPRLNAFAYFLYLLGGALLYIGLFTNTGPDTGWFSYVPLSGPAFAPGKRVDVWAQMITFTEISSLCLAVNTIATVFKMRAPGMSLDRIPLFVWAMLVASFMVVFAMPAVMVASTCLALDRLVGTHFFNPAEGGDAVLWQHLFWYFGHPEVYIIFMPGLGMISSVVSTFSRRPVFGYTAMVVSLVATGFLGFGLWVHHMFATGLPQIGASFFTAASMMIAIPTGVQIFCWIATLATGKLVYKTPLLFILGFFSVFVLGGLTGVMLASVPINLQVHDTFFVVAHFHYVLIGGAVFPLFAAIHFWFPKITGRLLDERLGRWTFGLLWVGFHVAFFPMHVLGLRGMPRRVYTYGADTGWGALNLLATVGAFVVGVSVVVFLVNVVRSLRRGELAGNDPWGSETLEWSASSPPAPYNFEFLPTVGSRSPRWDEAERPIVVGLASEHREVLITRLLDAEPDYRMTSPGPTLWPLVAALGTGLGVYVALFTQWGPPAGAVIVALGLLGWAWPTHRPTVSGKAPKERAS